MRSKHRMQTRHFDRISTLNATLFRLTGETVLLGVLTCFSSAFLAVRRLQTDGQSGLVQNICCWIRPLSHHHGLVARTGQLSFLYPCDFSFLRLCKVVCFRRLPNRLIKKSSKAYSTRGHFELAVLLHREMVRVFFLQLCEKEVNGALRTILNCSSLTSWYAVVRPMLSMAAICSTVYVRGSGSGFFSLLSIVTSIFYALLN